MMIDLTDRAICDLLLEAALALIEQQQEMIADALAENARLQSQLKDELADDCDTIIDQAEEIERLKAEVARLPRTRDGVPMFMGDTVWFYEPEIGIRSSCIEYMRPHASGTLTVYVDDGEVACLQTELYSTKQAALAAAEESDVH